MKGDFEYERIMAAIQKDCEEGREYLNTESNSDEPDVSVKIIRVLLCHLCHFLYIATKIKFQI